MLVAVFLTLLFLVSISAGVFGALVGLGGAVVLTPVLTLVFGVDIHFAIGASIVSIIATSSGAASVYVKDRLTNLRIGMFLELATTTGAILGAALAVYVSSFALELIFGCVLLVMLIPSIARVSEDLPQGIPLKGLSKRLNLTGTYTESDGRVVEYNATRPGAGLLGMSVAGAVSGLLGVGGGPFKVMSMDMGMRLPIKVSTTTSNFMIGVTAAASAGIYFVRGDVNPTIVAPVALGVLLGAYIGTRLLERSRNPTVRKVFVVILAITAVEMILSAFGL